MTDLQKIEDLFFEALPLNEDQRRALLAREPADLRAEVEALLEEDRLGSLVGPTVRDTAKSAIKGSAGPGIAPGARIGAYEIRQEIGAGGMGTVFLAQRADDAYHRQVAIKFVRSEYNTILIRERFERERRILGRLDHPFIARLLDAGSTEYDQPYFVMEYVENGKPITEYARERALSREDRVRLFTAVCEAVQYAHRNLTVHRDLKPGNILIDCHGNPKLLDFGIAKLLSADGSPTTDQTIAAGLHILTPDYASPEQSAGGLTVTTSSDVYSLGAVLWELLLDARPPRLDPGRQEFDPPSALGPDLGGILRMAMHRDPARRYATANDLREDLLRFLAGEPIRARTYSWTERAAYFTRTYRTFFAASVAIVAALTGVALWSTEVAKQAEAARVEAVRQTARAERALQQAEEARSLAVANARESERQKQQAQQERNLARYRSSELMDLSGQLLRSIQTKIDGLPGSAPARRELLTVAAAHLEKLAADPTASRDVHRDLALAYMQIGDLEGSPLVPNRGNPKAAMAYFDRAGAILTTTAQLRTYPEAQGLLVRLRARQAEIHAQLGDRAAMRRSLDEGLATGRKLASQPAAPAAQALPLVDILIKAALLSIGEERYDDAFDLARECRVQTLRQEQTLTVRDLLSSCWSAESRAESGRGHVEEAIAAIRRAIALREDVLHESPANNTARRALLIAYSHLSAYLGRPMQIRNARDTEGALKAMEKAREHAEFIFKSDPGDRLAQRDLAMSTTRLADLYMGANRYAEAAPHLARGAELLQVTVKNLPADNFTRAELVYTYKRLADALRAEKGKDSEAKALQALKAGIAANQELEKAASLAPGVYLSSIEIRIEMAKAIAAVDPTEAQRHLDQGLSTLARGRAQHPTAASLILFEIRMEADAGAIYETLSRPDLARRHREKALAAYRTAPAPIQSRWPAQEREALQAKLQPESR